MELSLLSFLNLFPATGVSKEGEATASLDDDEALSGDALASFEEWLGDIGTQDGGVGAEIAVPDVDVGTELVPNLVLAQGSGQSLTPAQVLEQLTGVDEIDLGALSGLTLSREQATKLADMMQKYLQRPDVNAGMGESQRSLLTQMITQLQQTTDEGQALASVLKPLVQAPALPAAEAKERAPLVGQMMKWLKQVLRDSTRPVAAAASTVIQDAPAKEPARISFPGDVLGEVTQGPRIAAPDEAVEEGGQDSETDDAALVVPVITLPVLAPPPEEVSVPEFSSAPVASVPATKNTMSLADQLIEESVPEEADASGQAAPAASQIASKTMQPRSVPSADFAQMLDVVQTHETVKVALDTAQPQLTLKAAAPLAQETPILQERMLGGSATGELKVLGVSPQREQALQLAESTQAVSAVTDTTSTSSKEEATSHSLLAVDGSEVVVSAGTTASGFHVGQSNSYQPSVAYHYANARVAVPEQVQVAVRQASKDGIDRIMIQLQPEELGRIDVRLDMHSDGRAHIVFTVDKADTFEQLQRDARVLEKALQEAGVQADAGSMEFNLRQHAQQEMPGFGNGQRQQGQEQAFVPDNGASPSNEAVGTETAIEDADTITHTYTLTPEQGLDIRV